MISYQRVTYGNHRKNTNFQEILRVITKYHKLPRVTTDIKRYESVLSIFLFLLVTLGNSW